MVYTPLPLSLLVVDFVTGPLLFGFYQCFLLSIEILLFLSFFVNFFLLAGSFISCVFLITTGVYFHPNNPFSDFTLFLKGELRTLGTLLNGEILTYPFSLPSLPKTFSKNPFHGQYLKRAERTMTTPINPTPSQKIPEMKKERTIRILPKMERTIDSCLPRFFLLTIGPALLLIESCPLFLFRVYSKSLNLSADLAYF